MTVYDRRPKAEDLQNEDLTPLTMAYIRWFKISEKLAGIGHQVDLAVADVAARWTPRSSRSGAGALRRLPLSRVDWHEYDVVKTFFHSGFDALQAYGGADHPFIISKLGSVVGPTDMDGIYFYGERRKRLYDAQERIRRTSRYVTLLSPQARNLWEECFGPADNTLLVPGAVDREIPPAGPDPYPDGARPRVVFAGNVYDRTKQPEANEVLVDKLNRLGRGLARRGARLYMIGCGDLARLDPEGVIYLGAVEYEQSWDYLHHADVGVVVAPGRFLHNNESTKVYHYLRAGLPVVSESGFPNDHVVRESGIGVVAENGAMEAMADRVVEAARAEWDRDRGVKYVLENHTWEKRVETYADLLARHFRGRAA